MLSLDKIEELHGGLIFTICRKGKRVLRVLGIKDREYQVYFRPTSGIVANHKELPKDVFAFADATYQRLYGRR